MTDKEYIEEIEFSEVAFFQSTENRDWYFEVSYVMQEEDRNGILRPRIGTVQTQYPAQHVVDTLMESITSRDLDQDGADILRILSKHKLIENKE